jgi:hypothetical protein
MYRMMLLNILVLGLAIYKINHYVLHRGDSDMEVKTQQDVSEKKSLRDFDFRNEIKTWLEDMARIDSSIKINWEGFEEEFPTKEHLEEKLGFGKGLTDRILDDVSGEPVRATVNTKVWLNNIKDKPENEWDWENVNISKVNLNELNVEEIHTLGRVLELIKKKYKPDYVALTDVEPDDMYLELASQLQNLPDFTKENEKIINESGFQRVLQRGSASLVAAMKKWCEVRESDRVFSERRLWYEMEPVGNKRPTGFLKPLAQYTEGVTRIRAIEDKLSSYIDKAGTAGTKLIDLLHDRHKSLQGFDKLANNSKVLLFDEIYANTDDWKFKNRVFEETLAHPKKVAVYWSKMKNKPQITLTVDGKKNSQA